MLILQAPGLTGRVRQFSATFPSNYRYYWPSRSAAGDQPASWQLLYCRVRYIVTPYILLRSLSGRFPALAVLSEQESQIMSVCYKLSEVKAAQAEDAAARQKRALDYAVQI